MSARRATSNGGPAFSVSSSSTSRKGSIVSAISHGSSPVQPSPLLLLHDRDPRRPLDRFDSGDGKQPIATRHPIVRVLTMADVARSQHDRRTDGPTACRSVERPPRGDNFDFAPSF